MGYGQLTVWAGIATRRQTLPTARTRINNPLPSPPQCVCVCVVVHYDDLTTVPQ
eukprot:m.211632 g.211632  ORF g.211632 m.211632 type:complete len:54 (-) comp25589_c0_seq1:91-252(-)